MNPSDRSARDNELSFTGESEAFVVRLQGSAPCSFRSTTPGFMY